MRVEDEPYIHYNKGSVVMYALQDYLGEDVVNSALRRFRDENAFKGPPYPTTVDLVSEIRKSTPAEHQHVIEDLFETITLYDNRAVKATMKDLGGEEHAVHIEALAHKYRADELGEETEIPLDDTIDVGVLDKDNNVLALEKLHVTGEHVEATLRVHGAVDMAGIDPRNMLIDRKPTDNVVKVQKE
jgi:hypothetical protein